MNQILNLLKQRRIIAGIVGVLAFILAMIGYDFQLDGEVLTDKLTAVTTSLAALISAGLSLWSYVKPKE